MDKMAFSYQKASNPRLDPLPGPSSRIDDEPRIETLPIFLPQFLSGQGTFRQSSATNPLPFLPNTSSEYSTLPEFFQNRNKVWPENHPCPPGQTEFQGNSRRSFMLSMQASKENNEPERICSNNNENILYNLYLKHTFRENPEQKLRIGCLNEESSLTGNLENVEKRHQIYFPCLKNESSTEVNRPNPLANDKSVEVKAKEKHTVKLPLQFTAKLNKPEVINYSNRTISLDLPGKSENATRKLVIPKSMMNFKSSYKINVRPKDLKDDHTNKVLNEDSNDLAVTEENHTEVEEGATAKNCSNRTLEDNKKIYKDLLEIASDHLVVYPDEFECPICICEYEKMEGIILHNCLHVFCRDCLIQTIELNETADVPCPFKNEEYACPSNLLEYEIKALLSPESYDIRLQKTLALAEASMKDTFHCKTPDCRGWCINDESDVFHCPVCSVVNCIKCKAIHEGITCSEYKVVKSGEDVSSKMSEAAMRDMIASGEAMKCPNCNGVITKQMGCDAVKCTFCQTDLCWATKGLRWGPRGKGDISGGCRCNVNGIRCHPRCGNCH